MKNILNIGELLIAILLIILILLQKQGGGLSSVFGGGNEERYRTKRGLEKTLLWATIVLAILFAVLAISRIMM